MERDGHPCQLRVLIQFPDKFILQFRFAFRTELGVQPAVLQSTDSPGTGYSVFKSFPISIDSREEQTESMAE